MRQGNNNNNNNNRRQRGRNNRRNNNNNQPNRNQVYDSNGPSVRVRGNAQQVMEKYLSMARDAQASGNHVLAEAHFQHGEHYLRIHLANQAAIEEARARKQAKQDERQSKNADDGKSGNNKPAVIEGEDEQEAATGEAEVIVTEAESHAPDPAESEQPDVASVEILGEVPEGPETIELIPESSSGDDQPELSPL